MTGWRFSSTQRTVAMRDLDGGGMESCLVGALPPGTDVADPLPPSPSELTTLVIDAVQRRLDDFAKTAPFDNVFTAATYLASKNLRRRARAQYLFDARDAHWDKCEEILAAVQAGLRAVPSLEDVLAEMPPLAWPT